MKKLRSSPLPSATCMRSGTCRLAARRVLANTTRAAPGSSLWWIAQLGVDHFIAPPRAAHGRRRAAEIGAAEKRAVEERRLENVCRAALDRRERAILGGRERFVVADAGRQLFNGCPARDQLREVSLLVLVALARKQFALALICVVGGAAISPSTKRRRNAGKMRTFQIVVEVRAE